MSTGSRVGSERSWLSRLLSSQETGLVVVIALLMACLTLGSKPVPIRDHVPIPEGASAQVQGDRVILIASGTTREFAVADGWAINGPLIERKERVAVPAGASVTELPEGRGVSAGGREYLYEDGWMLAEREDGRKSIERDPRRNKFLNKENLILVATVASFIAIMAVGMTGIIVMGGIDLSVGSIYALSGVIGATVLNSLAGGAEGWGAWVVVLGIGLCAMVGAGCGLVNGSASVGLGVHPFIITLGGMAVYRGVAFVTTKGLSIGDLPGAYGDTIRHKLWGMNIVPTLAMACVAAVGVFVFTRTVFGRRVFAIGGNEVAARYAGVPVGLSKVVMFTINGMLAGLSAGLALGYYGAGSAADGTGYELDVIAATVVGGASLSGGRGSALGAILGAIIIQLINNGFEVLSLDSYYRQIVIGLAIVLAVVVDQTKQRFMSGKR